MTSKRRVLVIAGSDSSGGAGLEADQKVIAAHGCYAMTATTALTAQNTQGVYDIHHVPTTFLLKQINAVFDDVGVDVVKTGMLASATTIDTVAGALEQRGVQKLVVDPVMVATTGAKLLPADAVDSLRNRLLPLTTILTPNIPEATLFVSTAAADGKPVEVKSVADMESIGKTIVGFGPEWVLVKGGHCPFRRSDYVVATTDAEKQIVVDVLVGKDGTVLRIETDYQDSRNTHGTGCSLASAIASNLANNMDMPKAVKNACRYIEAAIRTAPGLGQGNGPLNHFHSTYSLPFAPGRFLDYLLERPDVAPIWGRYVHHPFVLALGDGTLPMESFKGYLVQDYLYLIQFARANALASYKSRNLDDIASAASIIGHIAKETQLHIDYCTGFGVTMEEIMNTEEHVACTAYTRYLLEVGQSQDYMALQMALAPCLLGYGAIAGYIHANEASKRVDNPYWTWVTNYVAEDYVQAVKTGSALLERHAATLSPTRVEEIVQIFIHATKMEIAFWEMFPSK